MLSKNTKFSLAALLKACSALERIVWSFCKSQLPAESESLSKEEISIVLSPAFYFTIFNASIALNKEKRKKQMDPKIVTKIK